MIRDRMIVPGTWKRTQSLPICKSKGDRDVASVNLNPMTARIPGCQGAIQSSWRSTLRNLPCPVRLYSFQWSHGTWAIN